MKMRQVWGGMGRLIQSDRQKRKKINRSDNFIWVIHNTSSNKKRNFLGNYHKINGKYLQLYLNEFVYKFNRNYFEDFFFGGL